jgi:hypothetical protein
MNKKELANVKFIKVEKHEWHSVWTKNKRRIRAASEILEIRQKYFSLSEHS